MAEAAVATMGHNRPPADDAFAAFQIHIGDLFDEAKNHLDGEPITSEAQAEGVSKLLDLIRTAAKDADKARAAEKKPHDDAAKLVQAKWKPLLDRCELAVDTCKKVLTPWLQKKFAEQAAAADAARQEAEAKAAAAAEAMRQADVNDLGAREDAEAMVRTAKQAEAAAGRVEKARPQATGGERATTLRTYYRPVLTDASAALRHYVSTNPDAIKACLQGLAETDVRSGKRTLPGFDVVEEHRVV